MTKLFKAGVTPTRVKTMTSNSFSYPVASFPLSCFFLCLLFKNNQRQLWKTRKEHFDGKTTKGGKVCHCVSRSVYTKKGKKLFIVDVTATKDDDNIRTVKGLHIAGRDEIKIR